MKVAIVSDNLTQMGGAEKVVEVLHEVFPQAPIFTSIFNLSKIYRSFGEIDIRTSFLQQMPLAKKYFRPYFMLYPKAFEQFDLSQYDVVLSNSYAFAKGVITPDETCHICYCLTPMRFAWRYEDYVRKENFNLLVKKVLPLFVKRLKDWDVRTVDRVDYYIAISQNVAQRVKTFYGRETTIINPPVNTSAFRLSRQQGDYFLIASRLAPYKRIDLAIQAFNTLGTPLKIVGEGRDYPRLKGIAKPNIEFAGRVSNEEMIECYQKCIALVFPGEEDFGIAPLEVAASGRPVIAYGKGGALETVIDGKTGLFFYEQTPEAIVKAVKRFEEMSFDPTFIREHALQFDREVFKKKIYDFVKEKYLEHRQKFWSGKKGLSEREKEM